MSVIKYVIFLVPIFLMSCGCDSPVKSSLMTSAESTFYLNKWIDNEKEKNFENTYYSDKFHGCEGLPNFSIKMNQKGLIMIRRTIDSTSSLIKKTLKNYLTRNINLRGTEINDSPLYTFSSEKFLIEMIKKTEETLERMEKDDFHGEMIDFKRSQLNEWKGRLKALKTLKVEVLPEIDQSTSIDVDYKNKKGEFIVDSVLVGIFEIRDSLSHHHFKEPYLEIYRRNDLMQDTLDQNKLDALEILMPIRYIDWPNEKKYKNVNRTKVLAPPPIKIN